MISKRTLLFPGKRLLLVAVFFLLCTASVSAGERYAVAGRTANIRSGPGTSHEVVCRAERYYPLETVKRSGNWYQVEDFEADVGWIHKSLIQKIPTVITIKSKCNIRSGPGTKNPVLLIAKRGVPFRVLKRKGNWVHVRHAEGHEGWIHKSLVW